jgi:hypothetical protein
MEEDMDGDMDEDDPLRYINTGYDDAEMMSQPPYDSGYKREDEMHDAQEPERPRVECKKSLFMQSSQDTPPDATSTQGQLPEGCAVLSPTTLVAGVWKGLEGSVAQPKKKQRKRPAKKGQPPPVNRVADTVSIRDSPLIHVAGKPMLPPDGLMAIHGDLRRLHDHVLETENSLLASEDPGYPLYAVHVPMGKGYVATCPADMFFLRFDHIFDMYLQRRLDFTLVRLFALHMSYIIRKEQISLIAVADPYYMHEGFLGISDVERLAATKYIEDFMVMNKDKERIMLPYHPM